MSRHYLFAWVLGCVACGGEPGEPLYPDRGPVRVTVLHPIGVGGQRVVGASVAFLDANGTRVDLVETDVHGQAEADVPPGSSVTSVALEDGAYQILTVLDVQPGDDLLLGITKDDRDPFLGTFTVAFPAYTEVMPTSYTVAGPCGTATSDRPAAGAPPPAQVTLRVRGSCKVDEMELVVQANDADYEPIAVLAQSGVAFVPNGSTTIGGTYESPHTLTVSYINVHRSITGMGMWRTVPNSAGLTAYADAVPPMEIQTMTVTGAIGSGALVDTGVDNAAGAHQLVRQAVSAYASAYALDLDATLLPWLGKPMIDAATGQIHIPRSSTGTTTDQPDFVRLTATYERADPTSGSQTSFTWTVLSPTTDFSLPYLPYQVRNVMPTASDKVTMTAFALESTALESYGDAVRRMPDATLFHHLDVPAATLRFSSSTP